MHTLQAGDPKAPAAVFLHGFPEYSESWREILEETARAGLFAVAPDLRGYGGTDKPKTGYDLQTLANDVVELIAALGKPRAHVIGHDWGGAVAYRLAAFSPEKVDRLAVLNCPHPAVFVAKAWRPWQLVRSLYILAFQVPVLPDWLLSRNGGALVPRMLRGSAVRKDRLTPERLQGYADNFADPRTATAALAYYRAMMRDALRPRRLFEHTRGPRIQAPFRLIWAEQDVALHPDLSRGFERHFSGPVDVRRLPHLGHFLTLEEPETVAPLILEHLLPPVR